MNREWKNMLQADYAVSGTRYMLLFFGYSMYFILALCGDYNDPVYMANMSAVIAMVLIFYTMVRFTRREGEHWRSMYEKLKYFPVSRKKYLLAKTVPMAKVLGLQLAIQWAVFGCRMLMHRGIALEAMGQVSLYTAVSGICFFLGFLGLMVIGERVLHLFPLLFGAGIGLANIAGNIMLR